MLVKCPAQQRGGTESMEVILRQKSAGAGRGGECCYCQHLLFLCSEQANY